MKEGSKNWRIKLDELGNNNNHIVLNLENEIYFEWYLQNTIPYLLLSIFINFFILTLLMFADLPLEI